MMDNKKGKKGTGSEDEQLDTNVTGGVSVSVARRRGNEANEEDDECAEPVAKAPKLEEGVGQRAPSRGTYPKPKNFAERMMNVLENNVNTDVISWYGEENLLSVNIKGVKTTDILDDRFQGIKYSAFVRNLSRWGFRKVPKMDVVDGVVIYRNALFQRDNPHLVRHMKIDSDVQDIFGQHQRTAAQQDGQPQGYPSQPGRLHQQQAQQSEGAPSRENSLNLLAQLIAQQQRQQSPAQQGIDASSLTAQVSSILAAQQQSNAPRTADDLLSDILSLSRQYLDVAPLSGNSSVESLKSLLRLVIGLGADQLRARDPDGVTPDRPSLAAQLRQYQQQQQQQAQPQQQASAGTPLLQGLLMSMGQTQAQPSQQGTLIQSIQQQVARSQQAQPQPATSLAQPTLQSLLAQATGISSLGAAGEQQQQGSAPQPDLSSLLSQATGISSLGGAPTNAQVMLLLQQQQQNAQNSNQASPPGSDCRQS